MLKILLIKALTKTYNALVRTQIPRSAHNAENIYLSKVDPEANMCRKEALKLKLALDNIGGIDPYIIFVKSQKLADEL